MQLDKTLCDGVPALSGGDRTLSIDDSSFRLLCPYSKFSNFTVTS
ncbi:hypothetical protein GXM_01661 [Nostoc sphaeroides CCNUC1]|uniref:Uncharacterized protein n=1 Tax=Nostoc sphaeroides CCNUC1 TaxID=2653204 RepID=A0A5P8VUV5_9NOSO|nr:hypothetical protein GXM_01661 [Nostoc sphaeroides CCNUC1]